MPEPLGTIINDGKSESGSDPTGTTESANRISEPEIINGYESFEPDTERIDTGNARRTKSGKIDRRTRAGRSAGAGETQEEKPVHLVEKISLDKLLYSLHLMGAEFFKVRELEIDKDESKKLSEAIQEVGKYYAMAFDPKHLAFAQLGICLVHIYGPRAIAVKRRLDSERVPRLANNPPSKPASKPNGVAQPPREINLAGMSPSDLFHQSGSAFE